MFFDTPGELDFDIGRKELLYGFAGMAFAPWLAGPIFAYMLWVQLREMRRGTIPARGIALRWTLFAACASIAVISLLAFAYVILFVASDEKGIG